MNATGWIFTNLNVHAACESRNGPRCITSKQFAQIVEVNLYSVFSKLFLHSNKLRLIRTLNVSTDSKYFTIYSNSAIKPAALALTILIQSSEVGPVANGPVYPVLTAAKVEVFPLMTTREPPAASNGVVLLTRAFLLVPMFDRRPRRRH